MNLGRRGAISATITAILTALATGYYTLMRAKARSATHFSGSEGGHLRFGLTGYTVDNYQMNDYGPSNASIEHDRILNRIVLWES